ncbi:amidase enhancer [Lachnospiraceae bacterium]|nr:amidase enhancer [Lachnospiraceae bacterium]
MIWVLIVTGVYQCSTNLSDYDKEITDMMAKDNKNNKEDKFNRSDNIQQKVLDENAKTIFDEKVRILIMNRGYQSIYHTTLSIACSEGIIVDQNGKLLEYPPNTEITLTSKDFEKNQQICIEGKNKGRLQIKNIGRNSDAKYRGKLECYVTTEGIVVINELFVEEYLYSVVPSEMPSTYPEEALKAQAICARTYTYFHKKNYAYPEWEAHMDDSTAFQVYMNCEETKGTIYAVDETKNQVMTYKGDIVESFYYSTSSGFNGGAGVWNDNISDADTYLIETGEEIYTTVSEEGEQRYRLFIDNGKETDIEYNEAWYRWNYERILDQNTVKTLLQKIYQLSISQPKEVRIRSQFLPSDQLKNEESIKDIRILSRKKSGMVAGIMIETNHFRVSVSSQYMIRQVLGCAQDTIIRKDGSSYTMGDILPSAYFYIEKIYDKNEEKGNTLKQIILHGAGYGHGCGMSQNGAKKLAEKGLTAAEILAYYYNGEIKAVNTLY